MDIKQINSAIMFGSFSNTELNSIVDAVKWARSNLQKAVKRQLTLGDRVRFTSVKQGRVMEGNVTKIAIKYITVSVPQYGLWKVPANMLEAV